MMKIIKLLLSIFLCFPFFYYAKAAEKDLYYQCDDINNYIKLSLKENKKICAIPKCIDGSNKEGKYTYLLDPPEDSENYYVALTPAVSSPKEIITLDAQPLQPAPFTYFLNSNFHSHSGENKIDALEEILNAFLGPHPKTNKARVIFPINDNLSHWLVGEIIITQEKENKYDIQVYAHDPLGGGKIEKGIENIEEAIKGKMNDYYQRIGCQTQPTFVFSYPNSPYKGRRQHPSDSISCGIITAEDIVRRVIGKSLCDHPYDYGALILRYHHVKMLENEENNETTSSYLKRYNENIRHINHSLSLSPTSSGINPKPSSSLIKMPENDPDSNELNLSCGCCGCCFDPRNEEILKLEEDKRERAYKNYNSKMKCIWKYARPYITFLGGGFAVAATVVSSAAALVTDSDTKTKLSWSVFALGAGATSLEALRRFAQNRISEQ